MSKIGFLFSGQGSQFSGMSKELYDNFDAYKEVFDKANNILGYKLTDICFNEENSAKLNETIYSQPAIYTAGVAAFKLLESVGFKSQINAGLSLGEYSALTCSSVFDFEKGLLLISKRGHIMSEASLYCKGGMSAILGLHKNELHKICADCSSEGYVICANYNTSDQIVISGELAGIEAAEKLAIERGAKKAVRLRVDGAFHSLLMSGAKDALREELYKIEAEDFYVPIITNTSGKVLEDKHLVRNNLLEHMIRPVEWEESMKTLVEQGIDTVIELGCGKTLISIMKKINKDVGRYHLDNLADFKKIVENVRRF